jgi:hypothetical protein
MLPQETAHIHCAATGLVLFRKPYMVYRQAGSEANDISTRREIFDYARPKLFTKCLKEIH